MLLATWFLTCRLEACGRDLMVKLVGLFEKLYFTPKVLFQGFI